MHYVLMIPITKKRLIEWDQFSRFLKMVFFGILWMGVLTMRLPTSTELVME